ncbi:MAG: hypothetical protein LW822_10090 [Phycisphaeraceae bacterium]|jgi:hypothetical protein|nr:hypothetical protein [Phycisphaeraceae bacterium]
MRVVASGNFDDDAREIERLIGLLGPIALAKENQKWQLSLSKVRYLGPWAVGVIAAMYLRGELLHQEPRVVLPTAPKELDQYCVNSGLAGLVGKGGGGQVGVGDAIALERFTESSWDRPNRVVDLITRHGELSLDDEGNLRTCVHEVVQNVVDHAESPIGGLLCARYMSGRGTSNPKPEVRLAIVDAGRGVLASLRTKYPEVTTIGAALERIIEGNYSAKSRVNNQGLGVSNLFRIIANTKGRIAYVSRDWLAQSYPAHPEPEVRVLRSVSLDAVFFPGTAVFLSIPVEH